MIRYENDCVGCANDYYPCDPYCTRKRSPHFYCDQCGNEDKLYWLDGKQLCAECLESELGDEDENELDPVTEGDDE